MEKITAYLKKLSLLRPRVRFTVFSGTNTWKEWFLVLRELVLRNGKNDEHIIRRYENVFARKVNSKYAISFGAGRMALYAILETLGIGDGDEVILPAFTCVVVPNAIIYRGARPVYVDIETKTFNMDPQFLEQAINSRTRVIMAQHTFGIPCNLSEIKRIAKKYNVPIIEDCGHALGARYLRKPVGSLTEVAFFSSDHSKMINTFLGGMATTNSETVASRLRKIQSNSPFLPRLQQFRLLLSFLIEFIMFSPYIIWIGKLFMVPLVKFKVLFFWRDELRTSKPTNYPYPCRLSGHQALLGLSQLARLDGNLQHRFSIAQYLESIVKWITSNFKSISQSSWLRYSFLVKNRELFIREYKQFFDLGIWFTSVVAGRNTEYYDVGYTLGSCPIGEYIAKHIVNFPTHQRLPVKILMKHIEEKKSWMKEQIIYKD